MIAIIITLAFFAIMAYCLDNLLGFISPSPAEHSRLRRITVCMFGAVVITALLSWFMASAFERVAVLNHTTITK